MKTETEQIIYLERLGASTYEALKFIEEIRRETAEEIFIQLESHGTIIKGSWLEKLKEKYLNSPQREQEEENREIVK